MISISYPFVNIHTHHTSSPRYEILNCHIANDIPDNHALQYSVGLHPWDASYTTWNRYKEQVIFYGALENVVSVGETGIDGLRGVSKNEQQDIFLEHVQIAEELQKPIIIHCVRAFQEIISCKKSMQSTVPWIFHGFASRRSVAETVLSHGCFLSFGAAILHNVPHLEEVCRMVPENMFFIENDDKTVPVSNIYEKIADLRSIPLQYLQELLYKQWQRIFFRHIVTDDTKYSL